MRFREGVEIGSAVGPVFGGNGHRIFLRDIEGDYEAEKLILTDRIIAQNVSRDRSTLFCRAQRLDGKAALG